MDKNPQRKFVLERFYQSSLEHADEGGHSEYAIGDLDLLLKLACDQLNAAQWQEFLQRAGQALEEVPEYAWLPDVRVL